jgi:hypothetical protein
MASVISKENMFNVLEEDVLEEEVENRETEIDRDEVESIRVLLSVAGVDDVKTGEVKEQVKEQVKSKVKPAYKPKRADAKHKSTDKKYRVATSYEEHQREERKPYRESVRQPVSLGLDKEALKCTKPCFLVLKGDSEEFGVCERETCTFAHSLDELQLAKCAFGSKCYKRNDKSNTCQFSHPGETHEQFYKRTGQEKPKLPETSEKTRKPKQVKKVEKDDKAIEKTDVKRTLFRVPAELAEKIVLFAIQNDISDFQIETF